VPHILRKPPLLYKPALAIAIAAMCTLFGNAQVSCTITYSGHGFGSTYGPAQFPNSAACQAAAAQGSSSSGLTGTCSCTGGAGAPGFRPAPLNRGPSLAEIRREIEMEAAADAERRYQAAVKVEHDAETKNLTDRKSAAETLERTHEEFLRERDKLATMLRNQPSSSLTARDASGNSLSLREDTPAPVKPSKWGKEPPLPSPIGRSLSSDIPTSVDPTASADYIGRALDFIREDALKTANSAARKSALSGEMFAEAEMGPYGMTTVVMMNVSTLPKYVFNQISGAVSGQVSPEETGGMTMKSVNHIFNFSTPVNSAIENGVSSTIQGEVTGQAKQSLATLAASFLPVQEAKQAIASQATHISDTALDAYKHIFTPGTDNP
jgi:hypothetical protein